MSESRFNHGIILRSTAFFSLMASIYAVELIQPVNAQTSQGVTVNLGVLEDIDPMATVPRLLMPSTSTARGRIVLKPPPGVDAITPRQSRVVLRPPPGAPARVTAAPTIAVPPPAAAASAPPTPVTTLPPSAPEPPAPVPAPIAAVEETAMEAPAKEADQIIAPAQTPNVADDNSTTLSSNAEAEQTASLPPASDVVEDEGPISIEFGMEETGLPPAASSTLNDLASILKEDDTLRVQLLAYASSIDGSASSVRRKSLSRALSVREFLMDQGVQSTRIEVRALGDQSDGGKPNRVDAVVEKR